MPEYNLLGAIPKVVRNVASRRRDKESNRRISLQFGREYFDGTREQGYGGYAYDGRWVPVARDLVSRYGLGPGSRVLDVGCAKGFLVRDLAMGHPGVEAFGLDISGYAVAHGHTEVAGRLLVGNARALPFPDKCFDAVISINTVHNLDKEGCLVALREIVRVCREPAQCFVQVDAYRTPEEKRLFEDWMLTARTYGRPQDWMALFEEAGYRGDYYWTILEFDPQWTVN